MKLYQPTRKLKNREMFDFDSTSSRSYNNSSKSKNKVTWEVKYNSQDFSDNFDESDSLDSDFENIFYDAFESLEETEESLISASKMFKPISEYNNYSGKNKHQENLKKHQEKMELRRQQLEIKRKEIEEKTLRTKQRIAEERVRIQEVMSKQRAEIEKKKAELMNNKKAEEAQIQFTLNSLNNEFVEIQKKLKNISF